MKAIFPAALAGLLLAACSQAPTAAGAETGSADPLAATQEPASDCAADEIVVFACATGLNEGVALCGSQDAAQLRYVRTGEAAAAWPDAGTAASAAFRSGTLMYSGGGGAYLRFDREDVVHTVYTGIGRGWEKAGVVIEEGGQTVRELVCEGEVASLIGPDLFERASIPADDSGFEIP